MTQVLLVLLLFLTSAGSLNIGLEIIQIEAIEGPGDLMRGFLDIALPLKGGEGLEEGQMERTCSLRRLFAH